MGWGALPLLLLATLSGASSPSASLRVDVAGLRDQRGLLRFCLTRQPDYRKCDSDEASVRLTVPASSTEVVFEDMRPGQWSLMLLHDSNANGKLDRKLGLPREGFGFSRNPPIRFGPPSAGEVQFELPAGQSQQNIKIRYIF